MTTFIYIGHFLLSQISPNQPHPTLKLLDKSFGHYSSNSIEYQLKTKNLTTLAHIRKYNAIDKKC